MKVMCSKYHKKRGKIEIYTNLVRMKKLEAKLHFSYFIHLWHSPEF